MGARYAALPGGDVIRIGTGTRARLALGTALCVLILAAVARPDLTPDERFDVVVIDAGHGGQDQGARGPRGGLEKNVVLAVAEQLARSLRGRGLTGVITRDDDTFVSLEERTHIANDARGDVFVSIHANATGDARIRGMETFFLSLDATDDAARRLAQRENEAFGKGTKLPSPADDPMVAILGDMIANEHLHESQALARMAQGRLRRIDPVSSRVADRDRLHDQRARREASAQRRRAQADRGGAQRGRARVRTPL